MFVNMIICEYCCIICYKEIHVQHFVNKTIFIVLCTICQFPFSVWGHSVEWSLHNFEAKVWNCEEMWLIAHILVQRDVSTKTEEFCQNVFVEILTVGILQNIFY